MVLFIFLSSLQFFCKMVQKNPELFVYNFTIYLFSAMLGLCSYAGFPQLWQAGPTLYLQCAGFIVVASFAAEHRL